MKLVVYGFDDIDFIKNIFNSHDSSGIEVLSYAKPNNQPDDTPHPDENQIMHIAKDYAQKTDTVFLSMRYNHDIERAIPLFFKYGFHEIILPKLFTLEMHSDFISNEKFRDDCVFHLYADKPFLVHLETHVVDYCNLNCKGCNNFSSLVTEKKCASIKQFGQDLERLSFLFDGIGRLFLLGGEPLQDPQRSIRFMEIARLHFPSAEIRLLTNGLLVPSMQDSFWESVKTNDVVIQHTDYPTAQSYAAQIPELLETRGVKHAPHGNADFFDFRWTEYPFENPVISNNVCQSAGCHYLRDGKISKCPDAITVKVFDNRFGTSLYQGDEVDIYATDDASYILRSITEPVKMCSYCAPQRSVTKPWQRISRHPNKYDWIIDHKFESENKLLAARIAEKDAKIAEQDGVIAERDAKIAEQDGVIAERDAKIAEDTEKITVLKKRYNKIIGSRSWRYTKPFRSIRKSLRK